MGKLKPGVYDLPKGCRQVSESLGPRASGSQAGRAPSRERSEKAQLQSTAGKLSEVCRCQSGSPFPSFLKSGSASITRPAIVAGGKQYWELALLGARQSGGTPSWSGTGRQSYK